MTLTEHHRDLYRYGLYKYLDGDMHGASDAANDLRVLEARMEAAGTKVPKYAYAVTEMREQMMPQSPQEQGAYGQRANYQPNKQGGG